VILQNKLISRTTCRDWKRIEQCIHTVHNFRQNNLDIEQKCTSVEPEAKLKGDNKFYPCLYGYLSVCMSLFGFYSITSPKANHLKFMQKVRNYKKNAKFSFGLYYHFFCSGVLPLDLFCQVNSSINSYIYFIYTWAECWMHSSVLVCNLLCLFKRT
jgi:hypothetical protein